MSIYLSVTKILQRHEALKNGNKVIFYDKNAYKSIQQYLGDMNCSKNEKERNYVYDWECDYRPWNDGIHASCFFCWCNIEGTQYMKGFDCYV